MTAALPLLAACLAALALNRLPFRAWSQRLAAALLLISGLQYILWRLATVNTVHPIVQAFSLMMVGVDVVYLALLGFPLLLASPFDPDFRRRQATRLLEEFSSALPTLDLVLHASDRQPRLLRRAILASWDLKVRPRTVTVVSDHDHGEMRSVATSLGARYVVAGTTPLTLADLVPAGSASGADVIGFFQASSLPVSNTLTHALTFFSDERIGMVQASKATLSSESFNRNLGLDVVMPSGRDYSLHFLQVVRDRFNAVVGSAGSALIRRRAFSGEGATLPLGPAAAREQTLHLLAERWRIIYLNEALSLGDAPRGFAEYLNQRLEALRADRGIIQRSSSAGIWRRLDRWQQAFFLNHLAAHGSPLLRIAYLLMPLLALSFGFSLVDATLADFLTGALPSLILLASLPGWISRQQRVQFFSAVEESLLAVPSLAALMPRLGLRLAPPQPASAEMTDRVPAAEARRKVPQSIHLRWSWPFIVLLVQVCSTLILRYLLPWIPGLNLPGASGFRGESLMLLWNLYNAAIVMVGLLCCIDQPVQRSAGRMRLDQTVRFRIGSYEGEGVLLDLSETGACLAIPMGASDTAVGEEGEIAISEDAPSFPVRVVRCRPQGGSLSLGLAFLPLEDAQMTLLLRRLYGGAELIAQAPPKRNTLGSLIRLLQGFRRAAPVLR